MIIPIKQKPEPKIGTIRVIQRYSFLPTKVEISNGVWGWIWLEKWEERQRWYGKPEWHTIAKTLKTKTAPATDTGDHENKQTAVEWLEEALAKNLKQIIYKCDHELMESLFKQAKEMERKQHQNTWDNSIPFLSFDDYFTKKYNNGKDNESK